ncbi:sterol O-acyltransferase 2 isoform X2 [Callorhinchus milii]|uniref:sterol O-acyltransferase 2 isoform X2 n=1 Tax=Callorhinchus milii TaxID=7868 RepID=UPI001C3FA101|nr:sterol O-acyltransferase 2 isoform X2 [Callorhinchus milii]
MESKRRQRRRREADVRERNSLSGEAEDSGQREKQREDNGSVDKISHLANWQRHKEDVKVKFLEQLRGQVSELLDRALEESVQSFSQRSPGTKSPKTGQRDRLERLGVEKEKIFMNRCSILDELFEIRHIKTIYHMFIAALVVFIISTVAVEFIDQGRLLLDFDLLFYVFGKLPTAMLAWLGMFLYTLFVPFKVLSWWGGRYHSSRLPRLHTLASGALLATTHLCVLGLLPINVVIHYQLPPASRFIVILEQIRFLMKCHSFIRENVPKVLNAKLRDGEELKLPEFSSYLYFLFCPTLIYRDSYPRNSKIRWKYVLLNFSQVLGCLLYGYFILVRLCIPVFTNMSKEPFSIRVLILSIFHATLPGMFLLFLAFFSFLHCWLNAFAEMLRFGDRMFYKDWWNSTSFANYYRTWNVVVHDWLYSYTYSDFLWLTGKRCRVVAMLSVFGLSAVVHEYVLTLCLGYFYPVMFCLFAIFGVLFNFIFNDNRKSPAWNVLMWVFLFIGQGIQVCLYCQEWYAQIHCPVTQRTFWELVTPRSWTCRPKA